MNAATWTDVSLMLEALYQPPTYSRRTGQKIRTTLRKLAAVAAVPGDLGAAAIAALQNQELRRTRPRSVKSTMNAARTICRILADEGFLDRDPFVGRRLPRLRLGPKLRRFHSAEEIAAVLRRADFEAKASSGRPRRPVFRESDRPGWKARRLRALVYLLAYTGLRAAEALYLRPEEVHSAGPVAWVDVVSSQEHRTKTESSEAPVPLPPAAAAVLDDWVVDCGGLWVFPWPGLGRPWVGGSSGYRAADKVKALGERAGVAGVTLLSFRHSFITAARTRFSLPAGVVRQLARHSSEATQEGYLGRDLLGLAQAAAAIDFQGGPAT